MPLYNEALCGSAGKSKYCWPLFLNLSFYSSLLQEMGGASAMESVSALPGIRPCNVRLPAGTNELLLDVVLRTNMNREKSLRRLRCSQGFNTQRSLLAP